MQAGAVRRHYPRAGRHPAQHSAATPDRRGRNRRPCHCDLLTPTEPSRSAQLAVFCSNRSSSCYVALPTGLRVQLACFCSAAALPGPGHYGGGFSSLPLREGSRQNIEKSKESMVRLSSRSNEVQDEEEDACMPRYGRPGTAVRFASRRALCRIIPKLASRTGFFGQDLVRQPARMAPKSQQNGANTALLTSSMFCLAAVFRPRVRRRTPRIRRASTAGLLVLRCAAASTTARKSSSMPSGQCTPALHCAQDCLLSFGLRSLRFS